MKRRMRALIIFSRRLPGCEYRFVPFPVSLL